MYWDFGGLHSTMGRQWKTRELKLLITYSILIRNCICYTPHKTPYQLKKWEESLFPLLQQQQQKNTEI